MGRKKNLLVFSLIILQFFVVKAQDFDEQYIESYSNLLSIRFIGVSKFNRIELRDKENNKSIKLNPNANYNIGAGFNFKWIGINLAFNLPVINKDDSIYGKTKSIDGRLKVYGRKWGVNSHFLRYKGFYLDNVEDFLDNWQKGDPYPQKADLESISIGTSAYFLPNGKKFSMRALFNQQEKQLKSAGSPILGAYLSFYQLKNDSFLIPQARENVFQESLNFHKMNFTNFGAFGGYAYSLVLRSFYFSTMAAIGFGPQSRRIDIRKDVPIQKGESLSSILMLAVSTGFVTKQFNFGLVFSNNSTVRSISNTADLISSVGTLRLIVGKRFNI